MKRAVIIPYMLGVILGVIIVGMILEKGSCLGYGRAHLHRERYNRWTCKMHTAKKQHTASEIEFRLKNIAVNHPEKISFDVDTRTHISIRRHLHDPFGILQYHQLCLRQCYLARYFLVCLCMMNSGLDLRQASITRGRACSAFPILFRSLQRALAIGVGGSGVSLLNLSHTRAPFNPILSTYVQVMCLCLLL